MYRSVFRRYFAKIQEYERSNKEPITKNFYLSILGADPDEHFLRTCAPEGIVVGPASAQKDKSNSALVRIFSVEGDASGMFVRVMTVLPDGHADWSDGVYLVQNDRDWQVTGYPPNGVISGKDIRKLFK
jgi:hypothetical protein